MRFFISTNLLLALLISALSGCDLNKEHVIHTEKTKSWPEDFSDWPIERAKKSICKVIYTTLGKQKITGTGIAISKEGHILTSYHFIDAVIGDAGQKILGANKYAYERDQLAEAISKKERSLQLLKMNKNLNLKVEIQFKNKTFRNAQLIGVGRFDMALIQVDSQKENFLSPIDLSQFRRIKSVCLLGYSGTKTAVPSFGTLDGPFSQDSVNAFLVPNSAGDSGAPIFTKEGELIGILSHGEYGELVSASCLSSPVSEKTANDLKN